jgi:alpha-N-arabinofuranosidase
MVVAAAAQAQTGPAVLTIHADQEASKVSPTLYGLMTEEINHSYEGGLWAQMVQNDTMHTDWTGIPDWNLVEKGNSAAKMELDKTTGPSQALPYSMKLEVTTGSAESPAGALNDGFWGMALKSDTTYRGSLYAKEDSADVGPVTVSLVANESGKVLAQAVVSGMGTDWAEHGFTLKTGTLDAGAMGPNRNTRERGRAESMQNHLVITVAHPGTLWLQLVTLFPPTYHDRANGTRIDLMEKLAAMHPAFLRFPGGNYLEGDHIRDWYDWKKTIGPLVDRPGHPSPWHYWSTDGFGLLEFLEWCEDLHMKPVLAVYAGYSLEHDHVNPGPDLQPYVEAALEEIEYATGSTDTQWGAERAKDGHPEPFKISYVEIGNEDWFDTSGSYDGRFAQFYKAIKAKYPDLPLIATAPVKSVTPDVIDEHYYVRATTFFHDVHHYDNADRNGPKIFVGEWATREGVPTPNMGAALGDAAWMTGLERNSDIVVMASYAPLLVNVSPGALQWDTDLIGYNAMKSYGSPSYYAQVMFASYLGDEKPVSSLEGGGERFFYSVTEDTAKKKLYLKLVNGSSDAQAVDIALPGARVGPEAKVVSLTAHDTQATNTINQPTNLVPEDSTVKISGDTLHYKVPGYAIQVLVMDLR